MFQDWLIKADSEEAAEKTINAIVCNLKPNEKAEIGFPLYLDPFSGSSPNIREWCFAWGVKLIVSCTIQCSCGTYVLIEAPKRRAKMLVKKLMEEHERFNTVLCNRINEEIELSASDLVANAGLPLFALEMEHFSSYIHSCDYSETPSEAMPWLEGLMEDDVVGLPKLRSFQGMTEDELVYIVHPKIHHLSSINPSRFVGIVAQDKEELDPRIGDMAKSAGWDVVVGTGKKYV